MKTYKASDIKRTKKGHIMTSDNEYYLCDDGTGYSYWHKVEVWNNGKGILGHPLGNIAYDYCFRESENHVLSEKLNNLIGN